MNKLWEIDIKEKLEIVYFEKVYFRQIISHKS